MTDSIGITLPADVIAAEMSDWAKKNSLVVLIFSAEDVHNNVKVLGLKPITDEAAVAILLECEELMQEVGGHSVHDIIQSHINHLNRFGLEKNNDQ
jgi:hypothetical protein